MLYAIIFSVVIVMIFLFALALCKAGDDYSDVVERAVEFDFQDCLVRMDGYNDDDIIDGFEIRWNGTIPTQRLHYYIGRLIEAQQSFLGIGS